MVAAADLADRRQREGCAWANALERILVDDDLRRSMGLAARRRAETEFSYEVLAARLGVAISEMTR